MRTSLSLVFHPSRSLQLSTTNPDGCDWTTGLGSALPPFFFLLPSPFLHLHTSRARHRALLPCILAPAETAIAFRRPFFSHYILSSPSGVFVCYIALRSICLFSTRLINLSPSTHLINVSTSIYSAKSNEVLKSSQNGHCFKC